METNTASSPGRTGAAKRATPPPGDARLRIGRIEKRYAGTNGDPDGFHLGPLDLSVGREVVALLGPSGCGKTTLLRLVAGLERPDAGTVSLGDRTFDGLPPEARGAALVFQQGAVFPHLTARENVTYTGARDRKAEQMARLLEIEDVLDRPARTLSGGERRRVELARALAAAPRVLLLDEPTTGLDAPVRRRLRERLRRALHGLALPTLYVTHDQEEAAAVADRVAVMNDGRIDQVGPAADVFRRPATSFVARFTGCANVFEARVTATEETPGEDGARVTLDWRGLTLETAARRGQWRAGTDVWLCLRPEQIGLEPAGAARSGKHRPANVFDGHVERIDRFGGFYTLSLVLEAGGARGLVQARALPPRVRRLSLKAGSRLRARLAPEAIHLIRRRPADDE